jgi:hypothetical protein
MSVSMPPGFRLSPTSAAAIAGFPVDPWRGDGGGTRGMQAVAAADIMAAASGYIYMVCVRKKELLRRPPSRGANEQRRRRWWWWLWLWSSPRPAFKYPRREGSRRRWKERKMGAAWRQRRGVNARRGLGPAPGGPAAAACVVWSHRRPPLTPRARALALCPVPPV